MDYNYGKEDLLYMYDNLKRGRIFTLKMHEAVFNGLIRSSFHTPYGEESLAVGIASALKPTDWLGFNHRLQCALIMRYDLYQFVAEIFALRDGIAHGSAFDYHMMDIREDGLHVLPWMAALNGGYPMQTGWAYSRKLKGGDDVSVIVAGDASCSEGVTYEAWNLAALYKVPAVYIINNNGWGMTVPLERQSAVEDISEKAKACGLSTQIVDGTDVLAVRQAMDIAVEKARRNEPNVIEAKTLRWEAHFVGQGNDYRKNIDQAKVDDAKQNNDCVKKFEDYLLGKGVIDQAYIDKKTEEYTKELDDVVERASKSERPRYEDIYRKEFIYATPETAGEL